MKIIQRNIDELISAEYNPRQLTQHQHSSLTDSIKRFGLVDPIIVNSHPDRKDIIIGGHQRVTVAKEMGIKTVPTVEIELDAEKERELNVRLNRNTGEWDWDSLANNFDLEQLSEWGFEENQLVGFSDLDYSLLDDDDIDGEIEGMEDGTRKAIMIEFTLPDWKVANKKISELRKDGIYVGGVILECLNANA
tara:strand:+ start:244 stop:819 length:576 start_codon:yes stop_codon:yes gene_type:complete